MAHRGDSGLRSRLRALHATFGFGLKAIIAVPARAIVRRHQARWL